MRIHVGNLATETKKEELEKAFATFGPVATVDIMTDKDTGKSRGYAFVEMTNDADGTKAIAELNEQDMNGKAIAVSEARKRSEPAAK